MTVRHLGSSSPEITPSLRAVDPLRGTAPHPPPGLNSAPQDDCGIHGPRAEQSAASERAEQAYRDWLAVPESARPLATSSDLLAKEFDRAIHARWMSDVGGAYSNEALGRRCGIDEKGIRQWRSGSKRIPLAALMVMPPALAVEVVQWVSQRCGLGRHQRPVAALAEVLTRIERTEVLAGDRAETLRELVDAQRRIQERIAALVST